MEVIDECNILVKPTFNPKLSNYFTNLTGINNSMISNLGISIEQALKNCNDFFDQPQGSSGNIFDQPHGSSGNVILVSNDSIDIRMQEKPLF